MKKPKRKYTTLQKAYIKEVKNLRRRVKTASKLYNISPQLLDSFAGIPKRVTKRKIKEIQALKQEEIIKHFAVSVKSPESEYGYLHTADMYDEMGLPVADDPYTHYKQSIKQRHSKRKHTNQETTPTVSYVIMQGVYRYIDYAYSTSTEPNADQLRDYIKIEIKLVEERYGTDETAEVFENWAEHNADIFHVFHPSKNEDPCEIAYQFIDELCMHFGEITEHALSTVVALQNDSEWGNGDVHNTNYYDNDE